MSWQRRARPRYGLWSIHPAPTIEIHGFYYLYDSLQPFYRPRGTVSLPAANVAARSTNRRRYQPDILSDGFPSCRNFPRFASLSLLIFTRLLTFLDIGTTPCPWVFIMLSRDPHISVPDDPSQCHMHRQHHTFWSFNYSKMASYIAMHRSYVTLSVSSRHATPC